MTSSGHPPRQHQADPPGAPRSVAGRRWPRRWLIVAAAAVAAGAAGFLAALPFWHREPEQPARLQSGDEKATAAQEVSFEGAAYSPNPTADDLKREALRVADALREAFPQSPDALNVVGRLQFTLGSTEAATDLWRRCVELDPGFADAYFGMGLAAEDRGDSQEAASMFEKVMKLVPSEPRAPELLAEALMKSGRVQDAVAVLDSHVHKHAPSVDAVIRLGQAYLQLKEYEKAKQTFEALVEADPTASRAYWGLARVYAKLGQKEKSRQHLEKFRSLASAGQQASVREVAAYDDVPTVRGLLIRVLVESGQVYRSHGSLAEAERTWRKAAFLEAENAQCRRELLSLYEEQNRDRDALRICEELTEIEPENADHWLNVGLLNGRLGRQDAALTAIRKAIRLDPDNPRYRQAYELVKGRS